VLQHSPKNALGVSGRLRRIAPIKKTSTVLCYTTGTLKLQADGLAGSLAPLCDKTPPRIIFSRKAKACINGSGPALALRMRQ
jgi:hypothetical protein